MTKDEKELKQIEIVQKELTKQKSNFYESMGIGLFFGMFVFAGIVFISLTTYKEIAYSNNGLEECPNFHSSISSNTIWVRNCEETTKQYRLK